MRKLLLYAALVFFVASCSKDNDSNPNPSKTTLLTNNTWQMGEIIQQYNNTQTKYVKGGTNTTGSDYSVLRLKFNVDGTGEFTDPLDDTYNIEWEWSNSTETKMEVIVHYVTPVTLNYSFVNISENFFTYTTNYQEMGNFALATAELIPAL